MLDQRPRSSDEYVGGGLVRVGHQRRGVHRFLGDSRLVKLAAFPHLQLLADVLELGGVVKCGLCAEAGGR